MNDYANYVKEINNIYAILEKTKNSWNDKDNQSFVQEIGEYRDDVLACASMLEKETKKEATNK